MFPRPWLAGWSWRHVLLMLLQSLPDAKQRYTCCYPIDVCNKFLGLVYQLIFSLQITPVVVVGIHCHRLLTGNVNGYVRVPTQEALSYGYTVKSAGGVWAVSEIGMYILYSKEGFMTGLLWSSAVCYRLYPILVLPSQRRAYIPSQTRVVPIPRQAGGSFRLVCTINGRSLQISWIHVFL